jgi:hypothetical protein
MIVSPFETPEPYSTELVHGHLDFRIALEPSRSHEACPDSANSYLTAHPPFPTTVKIPYVHGSVKSAEDVR